MFIPEKIQDNSIPLLRQTEKTVRKYRKMVENLKEQEKIALASQDKDEIRLYRNLEMGLLDYVSGMNHAYLQGYVQGFFEGLKEGLPEELQKKLQEVMELIIKSGQEDQFLKRIGKKFNLPAVN
jgi:hypothetical protein